jgi:hypothetical protein
VLKALKEKEGVSGAGDKMIEVSVKYPQNRPMCK